MRSSSPGRANDRRGKDRRPPHAAGADGGRARWAAAPPPRQGRELAEKLAALMTGLTPKATDLLDARPGETPIERTRRYLDIVDRRIKAIAAGGYGGVSAAGRRMHTFSSSSYRGWTSAGPALRRREAAAARRVCARARDRGETGGRRGPSGVPHDRPVFPASRRSPSSLDGRTTATR